MPNSAKENILPSVELVMSSSIGPIRARRSGRRATCCTLRT